MSKKNSNLLCNYRCEEEEGVPDQTVAYVNAAWTGQGLEDWGKETVL